MEKDDMRIVMRVDIRCMYCGQPMHVEMLRIFTSDGTVTPTHQCEHCQKINKLDENDDFMAFMAKAIENPEEIEGALNAYVKQLEDWSEKNKK